MTAGNTVREIDPFSVMMAVSLAVMM